MPSSPGYVIVEVEVTDPTAFREYAEKAGATVTAHGGRLVVGDKARAKEGPIPVGNIVVLEFPSVAQAEAWYGSPAYAALIPLRQRAANSRLFIVEGKPR